MGITKTDVIESIDGVFSRYTPWTAKIDFGSKWHEPCYIPLDIESDLSHQVFAELVTRTGGEGSYLLAKENYTCQLHTEVALKWLTGFGHGIRMNHVKETEWEKKKLDLAFVDTSKPIPFKESKTEDVGDYCKEMALIGAIEFKRNLWDSAGFKAMIQNDLMKLKIAADAMDREKFWGILIATNLWYEKIQGKKYKPRTLPKHFEELLRELKKAKDDHYQIHLRTYHWHKAEAEGKNDSAIITEDSTTADLEYES